MRTGGSAEQVAGGHTGEGDVPDPVADQAQPPLDEEEADCGRQQAHDCARRERKPHELELKHGCATGRARRRAAGQAAVEDDPAADEDEALDEALDRAELVRDVEDRDGELTVEAGEQLRQGLLRLDVDARRRLVEDEQRRPRRGAFAMNARCC